ncbi:extensin family protein [Microvirga sp. HBU67558]|uniref:extensin-like domain-containing protein n=1 Tax=Microvirga TaxID=186650 RepID=UPI001B36AC0C|nr:MULTISPECIES: extensin family protein [unclassified Microvirga]MBQ0821721.1 extensin family protein [Microvirga sp. HBU67558]
MLIRSAAAFVSVLMAQVAAAQPVPPLPPPRPVEPPSPAPAPRPEPSPAPTAAAPPALPAADDCLAGLKAAGFEIEPAEPPQVSNDLCRIETPVRLKAVPVPTKPETAVRLANQPVLACRFAGPFGHWIGDLVAPLVAGIKGSDLKAVQTGPGFECRNRNRAATGKLSAHAQGLAIDIAGFELANGATLRIKPEPDAAPDPALAALRTAACGWFTTILGPGSDEAHHDHLHVDIEQHGSSDRYRICQ